MHRAKETAFTFRKRYNTISSEIVLIDEGNGDSDNDGHGSTIDNGKQIHKTKAINALWKPSLMLAVSAYDKCTSPICNLNLIVTAAAAAVWCYFGLLLLLLLL